MNWRTECEKKIETKNEEIEILGAKLLKNINGENGEVFASFGVLCTKFD